MAFIFVTSAIAEEDKKVHLNIPQSMNALITFGHCKANSKVKDKQIIVLNAIIEEEKGRVNNLFDQNRILVENYDIKKLQADEWKVELKNCSEQLENAGKLPWWKFDLKSMGAGGLIMYLILVAI